MTIQNTYQPLGNLIRKVDNRNRDLKVTKLMGLSMTKEFRETTSNIVGTDLSTYKIVNKWQFTCDFMSPIRVNKLPIVLKTDDEPIIVSPAYPVFEIIDKTKLDPQYLMMWFRRPEFDRYVVFKCDSAVRGGYDWDEMCATQIPIPPIAEQRAIVAEYAAVQHRMEVNKRLIAKLEETAQTLYKKMFVDGVDKENLPDGWKMGTLGEVAEIITRGKSPNYSEDSNEIVIGQRCVRDHIVKLEFSRKHIAKPTHILLQYGDILINSTGDGSLGRVGQVYFHPQDTSFDSHITLIRVPESYWFYIGIYLSTQEQKIESLAKGSTGQTELYLPEIEDFPTLLPPEEFLLDFETQVKSIKEYQQIIFGENNKLAELQSLLLARMGR